MNNSGAWLLKNSPVGSSHVIGGLHLEVILVEYDLLGDNPYLRKEFRIGRSCTIRKGLYMFLLGDPYGILQAYGTTVEDCVKQFLTLRGSM